ncbi:hypothetical protein APC24_04005 [Acinetobacter baumannii]|uniref:hypothetical protein n=1 Tax=Acinetobacter baumannii TaxID=470 RepID=UPI00070AFD90|nr:hypothetical protein [Acinetobacter baumannii]KQF85848.1 hypothetical protein APC24_04005 [Acinetobacter baumannii]
MRANWLCGRFCVQASSFENYIAEKPFTDRFVQQSRIIMQTFFDAHKKIKYGIYMDLNFSRSIMANMMDYFSFLISDYHNRPKDELDENGNYV